MASPRIQVIARLLQDRPEGMHGDFPFVPAQDLDKPGHMRAFEIVRQFHIHAEVRNGMLFQTIAVLDPNGVAHILHADLVDCDVPGVWTTLNVSNLSAGGLGVVGVEHGRVVIQEFKCADFIPV